MDQSSLVLSVSLNCISTTSLGIRDLCGLGNEGAEFTKLAHDRAVRKRCWGSNPGTRTGGPALAQRSVLGGRETLARERTSHPGLENHPLG